VTPPDLKNEIEDAHKRMDRYQERLVEVEDTVRQLNESETQPAAAPIKEL
jgi:hypothetical protein